MDAVLKAVAMRVLLLLIIYCFFGYVLCETRVFVGVPFQSANF